MEETNINTINPGYDIADDSAEECDILDASDRDILSFKEQEDYLPDIGYDDAPGDSGSNGSSNANESTALALTPSDILATRPTRDEIINQITDEFITNLDMENLDPPGTIAAKLLKQTIAAIEKENGDRKLLGLKRGLLKLPEALYPDQIAELMNKTYSIAKIACAGSSADPEYDLLALYMTDGPDEGTYVTSEDELYKLARKFNRRLKKSDYGEIVQTLRAIVPRKTRSMDRDLVAVNNGIFNFDTKELKPFDPDIVFLVKSHVNYNENAMNVHIKHPINGTNWDVESWMASLSDDPEIVQLLWEILSAIIRPHVRWNKSAWFYSETGNNGKGTLCELMRSLCGDTAYASIPLSDFSKDFALEPLTRSTAIIVDENDVGTFIDKAANLKAIITNDVISINRKFKTPISYQFYGFMVQCLNEFPRIKDKSDSFYRRQLFIPFEKCFTGKEHKYIKEDYLHRPEVLEYVLYRALHVNVYKLSEPEACVRVLDEFKENNDPVRQFMDEMSPQFAWDLLPFTFLYDLYKGFFKQTNPNGKIEGRNTFKRDLLAVLKDYPDWYCKGKDVDVRPGHRMDAKEYLIVDYNLRDWQDPNYTGCDIDKICTPKLKANYTGLLRATASVTDDDQ